MQLVGSLADGLVQNIPTILTALGQLILSLLGEIVNHLPEILEKGSEIVGKLAEGVINAIPKILEGIGQLLTQAKDAFLQTDWKSIGTNIIDGVVEGLKNAGSNLFSAMREMAGNALRAAKEKLKINSPSKVFRDEVGESIPEGMAAGIRKNSDMVTDAVDDMTGGLTDRVQDLTANIGQDFSYHGSTSIEVPVNLDGREIARGTAVYTDQQLAWESR
jgi:phage-related protein